MSYDGSDMVGMSDEEQFEQDCSASCSAPFSVSVPLATEAEKRSGWRFSYDFLKEVTERANNSGCLTDMETIETVLRILLTKKIVKAQNDKEIGFGESGNFEQVSLCATCVQADRTCPIYPQETQHCVEYRKREND